MNEHPPDRAEPIAIIGMGCRFPGARDLRAYWQLLIEGRETVGDYNGPRFPYIDQVFAADSSFASRIASRRGGFLVGLDQFDAEFFAISPREAALLDPQHRLLLEVGWEAVEDAGLVRERLAGSRTGVFIGVWNSDYEDCLYEASPAIDFHATTGAGRYAASGRLAFSLDLRGPALTVDTACSSSLVAIHLACQSLRARESDIALAGGSNAILRPEITLVYSAAGMLAPDGRCKFGDASADGYVRSEGAGIVVLKRLSRATADGDRVYAVIRGSAVNNDGRSSGQLIAPSREGQEHVIRRALDVAGVSPGQVAYVEAHGTGTLAGDPVEIESIGRVMTDAGRVHPCAIGSVKTNIGHTESAAGAAGVIKVALALQKGVLPASLHFHEPNPLVPWSELGVMVPVTSGPWPTSVALPVAGVSGFGITGTNAHVVLQAAAPSVSPSRESSDRPLLFLLSGATEPALRAVAESWKERLSSDSAWPSSTWDLAYTAAARRTHHESRLAVVAHDRTELQRRLAQWLAGEENAALVRGRRVCAGPSKAVFVFPGQGGQWLGMGRTLLAGEPVFREALRRCDEAVARIAGWSILTELEASPEVSRLSEIDVVQPTLFAIMIALAELWRSWGVAPSAVVGHSMGEVAAAVVAGALSVEDGAAVIWHRSSLMKRLRGRGLMAVVELSQSEINADLSGVEGVWLAAINGVTSTVVSGDADAIDRLIAIWESREIFVRRIHVDVASHSGHMDEIRPELERALAGITPRLGTIPVYSTVTGEIEDGRRLDASYWGKNLRQPVLFHSSVERLLDDGFDALVEINAHPVLLHSMNETARRSGREAVVTGSLRRDGDDHVEMLSAVGTLHVAGFPVDLGQLYPAGSLFDLPSYPWQRERHWPEFAGLASRIATAARANAFESKQIAGLQDEDPGRLVYRLRWDSALPDFSPAAPCAAVGHWLVLADRSPASDQLVDELNAKGSACTVVRPIAEGGTSGRDDIVIDPSDLDQLPLMLGDRLTTLTGVIHAWGLSSASECLLSLARIEAAQRTGCETIPSLVRLLTAIGSTETLCLWVLTAGVQRAEADKSANGLAQAPLWGVTRVVAREHPEFCCRTADLSALPSPDEVRSLADLIAGDRGEPEMLVRGKHIFVPRYEPCGPWADREEVVFRPEASYLVTGGLGEIGIQTARWMVERGARHLILTGRTAASSEVRELIGHMEADGAEVRAIAADIADAAQVEALIAATQDMPPLKGICHLAVATADALLAVATSEQFNRVLKGKAFGAWNLYVATREMNLDFCFLFSSIAPVVSQPGQGAYAAANSFLDGLARYAVTRGYPARSIQWGPWAGSGLSQDDGKERSIRAYADQGFRALSAAQSLPVLGYALAETGATVLAVAADWPRFREYFGTSAAPPSLQQLGSATAVNPTIEAVGASIVEQLRAADIGRPRRQLLEHFLRDSLARVLKIGASRIDVQKPVGSFGVDSLMGMEFVRRISASTHLILPATAVFNFPTVRKLATEIARRLGVQLDAVEANAGATQVSSGTVSSVAVAELSEEEAIRSLTAGVGGAT